MTNPVTKHERPLEMVVSPISLRRFRKRSIGQIVVNTAPDACLPAPTPSRDAANAASLPQKTTPFFSQSNATLFHGDALTILQQLPANSVDCVVTSPPYYGQRDYATKGQVGLEATPQEYIVKLANVFREVKRVLKPTGSLWVNIGDTYWSGKGRPHGEDAKQSSRRFARPQDMAGQRPLCTPKQLLLIPHRLAIAMQDDGWIVRNDNVWHKPNSMPDPVQDRCATSHEYVFHFVRARYYYFDSEGVAVPSRSGSKMKAPPSVWSVHTTPSKRVHLAVFPKDLVRLPLRATCPPRGVLLDPFCGSGTALRLAIELGEERTSIGIDVSEAALIEASKLLSAPIKAESRNS